MTDGKLKLLSVLAHLIVPGQRRWALERLEADGLISAASRKALGGALSDVAYGYRHSGVRLAHAKLFIDQNVARNEYCFLNPLRTLAHLKERLKAVPDVQIAGADIVDYGCGAHNPFSMSAILIANGARRVTAIEPGSLRTDMSKAAVMETIKGIFTDPAAFALQSGAAPEDMCRNIASVQWHTLCDVAGDYGPVHFRKALSDVTASYDLMLSTSVLEHVTDLEGEFRLMRALKKPDGLAAHSVDFTDHRFTEPDYHPFKFYFDGHLKDINGLRVSEVECLAKDAGFSVERSRQLRFDAELDESAMVDRYRQREPEDLRTRGATLVLS